MLNDFFYRVRSLFRRKTVEEETAAELRFHFEQQVTKYVKSGLSSEEARRRARLDFGGEEQLKEECREARGVMFIETLLQDIRYGLRVLGRTPAMTSVAILSLALGIGANSAIFSLIDALMLRVLPVQQPEQLLRVARSPRAGSGEPNSVFTNPMWEELRKRQNVFSGIFAWGTTEFDISQGGAVHPVGGLFASGDYFTTLGVQPSAGRLLNASDDVRGCPSLAVLSYGFWQEHFAGAASAVGSSISLDNHPFEIVGVSAPGFDGLNVGRKFDVAIPICASTAFDGASSRMDKRSFWWLSIMGRRKPGVSADQVNAGLAVISPELLTAALPQDWEPQYQQEFLKAKLLSLPGATGISDLRRQFRQPLNILMGVVALVLLIACANIASLMLARATARQKEIAVRKAMGASRARLIRQLLTECVLLSTAGAVAGILFAQWGTSLMVRLISTGNRAVFLDMSLNWRVLGFTAAVAVLTGLLFGVLPAFRSTRISLTAAMKGSQITPGDAQHKFRPGKWIVAGQVALSMILLMASGLFLRSLVKLATLDLGFDKSNVLIVHANLQIAKVPEEQRTAMFDETESLLRALPGVISASRSVMTPLSNYVWNNILDVDEEGAPKGDDAVAYFNFISPRYFETMRTPLLAGRNFNDEDQKASTQVAIVNETLAKRFYPKGNALGKYFRVHPDPGKTVEPIQIVGIVKDAKYEAVREDMTPTTYFPLTQVTESVAQEVFELRTAVPPSSMLAPVQEAVAGVSKAIPLEFSTLERNVDDSLVQERLLATLSTFFGGLALLLAMIGLYGALSYLVTQRQPEFGIRMALGAPQNSILGLVLRDVLAILVGGIAAGAAISLATVGVLQKLLFGLAAKDTATLVASAAILSAVAFLAGYLPARRATRVDPIAALRYE